MNCYQCGKVNPASYFQEDDGRIYCQECAKELGLYDDDETGSSLEAVQLRRERGIDLSYVTGVTYKLGLGVGYETIQDACVAIQGELSRRWTETKQLEAIIYDCSRCSIKRYERANGLGHPLAPDALEVPA